MRSGGTMTGHMNRGAYNITGNDSTGLYATSWNRVATANGYIDFGPANSSHAHIYTDRSNFYFNKTMYCLGGSTINQNDIRSTIFYDTDDTTYYVNPASSNSKIVGLNIHAGSNNNTNDASLYINKTSNADWGLKVVGSSSSNEYGLQVDLAGSHSYNYRALNNGSEYLRIGTDLLYHNSSVRAPIFYDTNDTAYYTDPQSTSRMNYVKPSRISCQNNGDQGTPRWDFRAYVVESPHIYAPSSSSTMYIGESNHIHIRSTGQASGDFRAPIFYDSNNTGYYMDPASTSYVNYLGRKSHNAGHLVGSYNSVGANSTKSNPIYTIGSSYNPNSTTLSNMYGIGYSHSDASFIGMGASGWGMYVAADGDARVYLSGGNGAIHCTGNITAYASDERLKTNIKPIENALDKVGKIRGVTYDWVDDITSEYDFHPSTMHETGVLAQEIQEVIPDAVTEAPMNSNYTAKNGTDHEFLTVQKDKIVPLLIEAIKELKSEVDDLKAQLESK